MNGTDIDLAGCTPEIVKAGTCPSCSYSAAGGEFETCPRCGLIISKYHSRNNNVEPSQAPSVCENSHSSAGKTAIVISLVSIILLAFIFFRSKEELQSPAPPTTEASQKQHAADTPLSGTSPSATSSPATSSPAAKTQPANPSIPPIELPVAMPNSLGITKTLVFFAPTDNNGGMPSNDHRRISINERRIYAHVKIVIPPEKSYQCNGKLYDGEGKLVMNIHLPITPKVASWYVWYYHDIDRGVDKPGIWKFSLFVNGEQVAEHKAEVTEH